MNDKELYNKYQDSIPDYETFKSIKDKKLKSLLFNGWVAKFGSKEIRSKMNISYSTYDYNVRHYREGIEEEKRGRPKGVKNKPKEEAIDVSGYTVPNRVTIEADFEEIVDENKEPLALEMKTEAPKIKTEAPEKVTKPFIHLEWMNTPESISAQLEALATVLKFERGTIKINLEVFKNGEI